MSVLVIMKFQGDVAQFQQAMTDRGDQFAKVGEIARTSGGIHHRFGVGDGYVVVVDEWESVEDFERFSANPDLQALVAASGAGAVPPEIIIAQAVSSPDEY